MSAIARMRAVCASMLIGVSIVAPACSAEAVNPEGELTLARALDAALRSNPHLLASAYELNAAQARIVQAGLRPNPQLAAELENFVGSGGYRQVDALETTLSLSQVVELGSKRVLRRSVAESELDTVTLEQRARELDVLAEVTRRFIDAVAAQERVRFESEAVALAQQTLDAIAHRVQAGRSPEAERSRARIAVTRAELEHRSAQGELRGARYVLASSWGSAEPAFTSARADLFDLRRVESFPALIQQLERSPELLIFVSEARLREAELRLAQAQARPDLNLSLGVRRFEASNDAALVAGFSLPLPISNRNQGAIREAHVRMSQNEALRVAALVRARASLVGIYQEMDSARVRVDTLRNDALPLAQQALEQTRAGYERGRFSFLELATAQQELLALRAAVIDAAADYHRMLAEIERLTSAPLIAPTP